MLERLSRPFVVHVLVVVVIAAFWWVLRAWDEPADQSLAIGASLHQSLYTNTQPNEYELHVYTVYIIYVYVYTHTHTAF